MFLGESIQPKHWELQPNAMINARLFLKATFHYTKIAAINSIHVHNNSDP